MIVKEKFYVGYSEINTDLRLKNTSILKIFENMACRHGAMAGDSIKTSEARWFLTGYNVRVHNRPEYETNITVNTWSRDLRGVFASREFEIINEDGTIAVTGISNWSRVNALTGKPERATPEAAEAYGSEPERTNFGSSKLDKLKECEEYILSRDYYIDRNFIDANNHMNNVCYLELAELVLPEEIYRKGESDSFEIMYRKATKYGETVKCLYGETEDAYIVTVKSQDLSELRAIIKLYK